MNQAPQLQFDESKIIEAVDGLTHLGYLTNTISRWGHNWSIRTLYGNEELLADKLCKEYIETTGQAHAYGWSRVCMTVYAIDGRTDFCPPIGPDEWDYAQARFRYFTSNWFWPTANYIYSEYVELQRLQVEAYEHIANLSSRSLRASTPSPDSLNEPGDSPDLTDEANRS